jgi:hypothetical protein
LQKSVERSLKALLDEKDRKGAIERLTAEKQRQAMEAVGMHGMPLEEAARRFGYQPQCPVQADVRWSAAD